MSVKELSEFNRKMTLKDLEAAFHRAAIKHRLTIDAEDEVTLVTNKNVSEIL